MRKRRLCIDLLYYQGFKLCWFLFEEKEVIPPKSKGQFI